MSEWSAEETRRKDFKALGDRDEKFVGVQALYVKRIFGVEEQLVTNVSRRRRIFVTYPIQVSIKAGHVCQMIEGRIIVAAISYYEPRSVRPASSKTGFKRSEYLAC